MKIVIFILLSFVPLWAKDSFELVIDRGALPRTDKLYYVKLDADMLKGAELGDLIAELKEFKKSAKEPEKGKLRYHLRFRGEWKGKRNEHIIPMSSLNQLPKSLFDRFLAPLGYTQAE